MPVTVIIGAQWGDEGKGKIADLLSAETDVVARYQGGANAGHTIAWDDQTVVLHLVPSGVFQKSTICVIGNGVVIDPVALLDEIKTIEGLGFALEGRLLISHHAHLIMPYHKRLDQAKEQHLEKGAIGTTGRGIGPAYIDKYGRSGIRVADLLNRDVLRRKLKRNLEEKNEVLRQIYRAEELDVDAIIDEYVEFDNLIDPYITDTSFYLNDALKQGKRVLAEGAQGCLLDVDFGTYPFVTSSNPTVGGCCTGLGIPPQEIDTVIGITKAYTTRVGNGPFPTELEDGVGDRLRAEGAEFGATTGRPRRCGWLDLVALRYAAMVNGMSHLAITKLDVLNEFDEIFVATAYEVAGRKTSRFPADPHELDTAKPIYDRFTGWSTPIHEASRRDELPTRAQEYLSFISNFIGLPISHISTGPKRSETIIA